jgi:Sigma-70, region 4
MHRTARGVAAVIAVVCALLALVVGRAVGLPAVSAPTPKLQPVSSLPSVPSTPSVPSVPDIPHVPVPSAPDVPSTPSVPDTPSTPSVPSAQVPSVPRNAVPGAVTGRAPSAPSTSGSGSSGATGSASGSSSSSSEARTRAAAVRERRRARAARAAHERRLRDYVERYSGCLSALPSAEGRLLALRAGAGSGSPLSRSEAARRLGISTGRAAVIERRGLRLLRDAGRSGACGKGAAAKRRSLALGTGGASVPSLEPAVLLAHQPALTSTEKLGRQGDRAADVEGGAARAGGKQADGGLAGAVNAVKAASSDTVGYVAAVLLLALLTAGLLVAWRRRGEPGAPRLAEQTGSAAVWWPTNAGEAPPEALEAHDEAPTLASPFLAPQPPDVNSGDEAEAPIAPSSPPAAAQRPRRPAAIAAASLASLGVAILRRRRR